MDAQESITFWINQLKAGESAAEHWLWEAYYRRLVGMARRKLAGSPRALSDEEDVALCAFNSFFRGVEGGRFPDLKDRGDLWQVLLMLTVRKARASVRAETAQKRGGRHPVSIDPSAFAEVMGREPTPQLAAQVVEECRRLLQALGDDKLRAVAMDRMEGYSNAEIAERQACTVGTVERKLALIRGTWRKELADEP